ncbi:MAG: glycosyltransferase family 2 protein [Flavobacteriia bacterium]|nr:glycosyltransferase family 2 protein [Flavobacteriia bacterium]
MNSKFKIPQTIEAHIPFRHTDLRGVTGDALTQVYQKLSEHKVKSGILVSIVIPAHNEERVLFATLRSLAAQETDFPFEVIVVDNNSSDRTAELALKSGALVCGELNQGVAWARQKGLIKAQGEIIVTGDADTLYPPHWLQTLVEPLRKDSRISCTYSLHCLIDENDRYAFSHYAYQHAKRLLIALRSFRRGQLNVGGASMAFRKKQAYLLGGYNLNLNRGEDGYLALRLTRFGSIQMVADKQAYVYTSNRRMLNDGHILHAFMIRALHSTRHMLSFLSKQQIPAS